jgi:predicted metal-dependent hydrolase
MLVQEDKINIKGTEVPLRIFRERRKGWRFSFVKDGAINVRLPVFFSPEQDKLAFVALEDWLQRTFERKSNFKQHFSKKQYAHGDELQVGKRTYRLDIELEERKSHTVKLINGTFFFKLAANDDDEGRQKAIRQLMSRIVAQDFMPEITRKTMEINRLYFQKNVKSISFKYNHSNWGSCSRTGNINFSTRLLFAPDEVIDYVIIHELAHLIEMNHSDRFWNIVERIMPDYRIKEKWLSENGALCDF